MDSSQRQAASLAAFTKISKATMNLSSFLAKEVELPPILQGSGFPILEALLHKGCLSQREISRKILKTTGNISQALDKLEESKLVVRGPGPDRRTYTISLTPEGKKLIDIYFPLMAAGIEKAFQGLTTEELCLFSALAKKLGTTIPN